MKKTLFIIIPLIAVLMLFIGMRMHRRENGMLAENTGYPAPAITAHVLGSLGILRTAMWQGQVYAVNFFGSWCPECRAEHDTLRILAGKHVGIIGVATNDNDVALGNFLVRKGNPYSTVALDPNGWIAHGWGLTGVPETFIVDKDGIVRFHYIGPMSESVAERDFLPVWNKLTQ